MATTHTPLSAEEADRFRAFERRRHDSLAPSYAAFFAKVTAQAIAPLLAAVRCAPGQHLLDIASGPGDLAAAAAARGARAEGVDLSPGMVILARQLHPGLTFQEGHVEALPFDDAAFDAIAINFGIGHFPRPEAALEECLRVLRPGGWLALSWWDVPGKQRLQGLFRDAIAEVGAAPPPEVPQGHSNLRFCETASLHVLLAGAGLAEIAITDHAGEHVVANAEALWLGGLGSLAVTAASISHQPAERQAAIRAALERRALAYASPRGLVLPIAFKLAAGRRPG